MDLEGRSALVTGGAHRVGRALSLGLAQAGARVVVNYRSSGAAADVTVRDIEAAGGTAVAVCADVAETAGRQRLIDAARDHFGGLDILVNSASLFEQAPFADVAEADFDRVIGVNLRAPFFLSQLASPLLAANGGGAVVNIVDLSALQPWPSFSTHAVSKAGLAHLTRVLARALAPHIRVNAIAPGNVLPPEDYDGRDFAGGSDRRVVARPGRPEDVVDALLWLLRADFVTGQVITVDGGRILL
jgi:NAD(P)-dependent dehydrogenase (short-subunit alcohol dehydrogenase family)